jgi:DNA-binding MarR family transcriptional regulator
MAKHDAIKIWALNYRLLSSVLAEVADDVGALGIEVKELFVLAEIEERHAHPASLAARLSMPKPTITLYLKRLEAAGLVRREIDATDHRRHRLQTTPAGKKVMTRGLALLSDAFEARLAHLTAPEQKELEALLEKMAST